MAGYDIQSLFNSTGGITATLVRRDTPALFGSPAYTLKLSVEYHNQNQLRIVIRNPYGDPYERNASYQFKKTIPTPSYFDGDTSQLNYQVVINEKPFGIAVIRKSSKTPIFDTRGIPGFSFEGRFLSLTTRTPQTIYGFGEQTHPSLKHDMNWHKWSAFARDQPVSGVDYMNLYGTHPFYMGLEKNGDAHGIVLFNSHAQHVELAPYPTVTYRTIGGDLEFQLFLGPTPDLVVQQYVQVNIH